ncbi:MAG TPA: DUF1759 domain-containing protein [Candidatus Poseidoniales archaeon]|nr:DUF1759 domain-containing protein [Candidatus Poseidoniales archaeon]
MSSDNEGQWGRDHVRDQDFAHVNMQPIVTPSVARSQPNVIQARLRMLQRPRDAIKIDLTDFFSGQHDHLYYDPTAYKQRINYDLRPPIFTGEDATLWQNFLADVHTLITCKNTISWPEKFYMLRSWLTGTALRTINYLDRDMRGYKTAIAQLNHNFQPALSTTRSLTKQLASLQSLDDERPETLREARILINNILYQTSDLSVNAKVGLQDTVFNSLPWLQRTQRHWEDFIQTRGFADETIELFEEWVDIVVRRATKSAHVSKISKPTPRTYFSYQPSKLAAATDVQDQNMEVLATYEAEDQTADEPDDPVSDSDYREDDTYDVVLAVDSEVFMFCPVCKADHKLITCTTFLNWTVKERWSFAKKIRACFICLEAVHQRISCQLQKKCSKCSAPHHDLLHRTFEQDNRTSRPDHRQRFDQRSQSARRAPRDTFASSGRPTTGRTTSESSMTRDDRRKVELIRIALSNIALATNEVAGATGDAHQDTIPLAQFKVVAVWAAKSAAFQDPVYVNAVLDNTSKASFITPWLFNKLKPQSVPIIQKLSTMSGVETRETHMSKIFIKSYDNKFNTTIAMSTSNIPTGITPPNFHAMVDKFPILAGLEGPRPSSRKGVDLLLGINALEVHRPLEHRTTGEGEPIASKTPLGWTLLYSPEEHVKADVVLYTETASGNAQRRSLQLRKL